jgi:hypothetical protein
MLAPVLTPARCLPDAYVVVVHYTVLLLVHWRFYLPAWPWTDAHAIVACPTCCTRARMRLLLLRAYACCPCCCVCCCYLSPPAACARLLLLALATRARIRLQLLRTYACHATGHARGDHLCRCSLAVPANENTCNMKYLLQHTSETNVTFGNIRLQHMSIATATYATSR